MTLDNITLINYKLLFSHVVEEFPVTKWEWSSVSEKITFQDENFHELLFHSNMSSTVTLAELIGCIKKEDQLKVLQVFSPENYESEDSLLIKFRIESSDYRYHLIECFSHLHKEEDKVLVKGVFRDISKFVYKVNELNELRDQISERQRLLPIGYWEMEPQSKELRWSEELYNIYGINNSAQKPSSLFFLNKIVHPEDADKVKSKLQLFYKKNRPFSLNYRIIRPDGTARHIQARASVIKNSEGELVKYMGASIDITEY